VCRGSVGTDGTRKVNAGFPDCGAETGPMLPQEPAEERGHTLCLLAEKRLVPQWFKLAFAVVCDNGDPDVSSTHIGYQDMLSDWIHGEPLTG
jgi:hypothetical protein